MLEITPVLHVGVDCGMPWSPLGGFKQGKGLQSDTQLLFDSHPMQRVISAQALTARRGRQDSVTAQARSFCCLPHRAPRPPKVRLKVRRQGLARNCRKGIWEEHRALQARGGEQPAALLCSQQHTFQQQLLIELPAGAKFSTGAYSYQPYNTAQLFKTSSKGTLPEEQHARGQIKLDGWEENGNPATKSRNRVLKWGAPCPQAAPGPPQSDRGPAPALLQTEVALPGV